MIRQMNKNDKSELERVCKIWIEESFHVHNFIDDYKNFWLKRKGDFILETIDADGYVFEEDRLIKGFMTIKNTYIRELFVDLGCQEKGIGTALSDLAKQCFNFLSLHVYVRNIKAVNWWFRRGFLITKMHESEAQMLGEKHIKYEMVWSKPSKPEKANN